MHPNPLKGKRCAFKSASIVSHCASSCAGMFQRINRSISHPILMRGCICYRSHRGEGCALYPSLFFLPASIIMPMPLFIHAIMPNQRSCHTSCPSKHHANALHINNHATNPLRNIPYRVFIRFSSHRCRMPFKSRGTHAYVSTDKAECLFHSLYLPRILGNFIPKAPSSLPLPISSIITQIPIHYHHKAH